MTEFFNDYLRLQPFLTEKKDLKNDSENRFYIFLIFSDSDLDKLNLPASVKKSIISSFESEQPTIWTLWKEETILISIPNTEAETIRLAGAKLFTELNKLEAKEAILNESSSLSEEQTYSFLEGLIMKSYRFDKYLKAKNKEVISFYILTNFSEAKFQEMMQIMKAISLTKTMVNESPNSLNSLHFSQIAQEAGKQFGFDVEVLDKTQITDLKMGGLLNVNKGSEHPPTFNIFKYQPKNALNKKALVLVGKGVTFDTGGYSLKISGHMIDMKSDMAGGATVLGIISAIAANQLPYQIIGLVPATDNMISSKAMVVDDIITTMDGTTVEVANTDAEGRLILCDALTYAKQFDPELVIDMATLTGASAAITGHFGISVLGNEQKEINSLIQIGEEVYERLIQLPLWKEYRGLLKSNIADLKNIGGPIGGVSTAAKFLEHFTSYPWIHLDIAGIATVKTAEGYRQVGATGAPLRLIYEFVKQKTNADKID